MLLCTSVSDHRIALQLAFHLIETNNSTIKRGAGKKKQKERKETNVSSILQKNMYAQPTREHFNISHGIGIHTIPSLCACISNSFER